MDSPPVDQSLVQRKPTVLISNRLENASKKISYIQVREVSHSMWENIDWKRIEALLIKFLDKILRETTSNVDQEPITIAPSRDT